MRSIIDIYEGIFNKDNSKNVGKNLFKEEVINWLSENCTISYFDYRKDKKASWEQFVEINSDNSVNINNNIFVKATDDTEIPFKINKVTGKFTLWHSSINSCKNFPNECDSLFIVGTRITLNDIDMTLHNCWAKQHLAGIHHPESDGEECVYLDVCVKIGKNVKFTCTRQNSFKSKDPRFIGGNPPFIVIKSFTEDVMKNIKLIGIDDVVITRKLGKHPTIEQVKKYYDNFPNLKHIFMTNVMRDECRDTRKEIYITDKDHMEYVTPPQY